MLEKTLLNVKILGVNVAISWKNRWNLPMINGSKQKWTKILRTDSVFWTRPLHTNRPWTDFYKHLWRVHCVLPLLLGCIVFEFRWQFSDIIFTRRLVGSTDQACSSGFCFRSAWKSTKWPCFLQNNSLSFLQGLRSLKNRLL